MVRIKHASFPLILLFSVVLVFTCAPEPAVIPEKGIKVPVAQSPSFTRKTFDQEWQELIAAAKKEGTVVLFLTMGADARMALTQSFYDKFGIVVDVVSGSGGELVQKIKRERSAGLYAVDVFVGGATTPLTTLKPADVLDPLKPALMLPELTEPEQFKKIWYAGDVPWLDADKKYLLALLAAVSSDMAVNTNLVNPEADLKSYKDLLNPRWKGKIEMLDPTIAGNGSKWFAVFGSKILGFDYMRELVSQQPVILRDRGQMGNWLAQGKVAIAIAPHSETTTNLIKQGAPMRPWRPPAEGTHVSSGSGSIALINRAPHPNAARLLINWMLSKEGSTVVSKATGNQGSRVDVPMDFLNPFFIRQPGVNYFESDREEFIVKMPEYYEMARQIFAPLLK